MKGSFGSAILDYGCRLMVPFNLLFALYVVVHGHDSPGGGFQGGTILASTLILVELIRGEDSSWRIQTRTVSLLAVLGLTLYTGVGIAALFYGGNFLDYGVLPLPLDSAPQIRAAGTLLIETGVALGVAGVLMLIYRSLTQQEN